ncbi:MAG TPA: ferrochelatase [Candidatus Acidoferrales bacterium]|jgi:ferrochelatase|nr:ferrochelatase [Candidatus Acidoferrales bacterium]
MPETKNIAVVLFQLGGPDSQEAVEPFLFNLFSDPDIINFPGSFLARKPLAKLISSTRSKSVRVKYAEIGGASPIRRLTEQQGRALEAALRTVIPARVIVAMRYWHPNTIEAISQLDAGPFDELVLLPLYPHYSFATTGSSLKEWNRYYKPKVPVHLIDHFFDHPDYLTGVVERTNSVLRQLPRPDDVHLVFSAHGLPMALVESGDPYPQHIEATVKLVCELGAWPNPHTLCFQSRVGPQKWLQPPLTGTIERLAREGVRRMLVIPISFLTEHIETLHEINIEAREQAESLGIRDFHMMPALNDSPLLIRALADLTLRAVGNRSGVASLAI